jgi:hypothetical protein
MATTRKARQTPQEFIPSDEAERRAQIEAGQLMATIPDHVDIPEYEPEPDDIALQTVLSELGADGSNAKVNVYQLDAMKNKAFVGAFLPTEFSLENVQKQYGPGDYEIRVYDNKGLKTRRIIKIAEPKMTVSNLPVTGIGDAKILETMQNGFKEMGAMFANALAGIASNQPKPKTTMEMLQEMQLMREIMGVNNAPAQTADPLQMVEMAMSLAEKIQPRIGEPGTGEVILEAIKNFGPMIATGLQKAQTENVTRPVIQQNPVPQISQSPVNEGQDEMNVMKKYYLNLLIAQATNDNDPYTYANMLLDVVGDEQALQFVNTPDWFERLCSEDARAANFRPWFDRMRAAILDLTSPDETGISSETPLPPSAT